MNAKAHVLDQLLEKGHHVVTTVRSEDKAKRIREAYPNKTSDELDVVIVPDIADPTAFDEVVKVPGLEVVMHTASPFHLKISEYHPKQLQPFFMLNRVDSGSQEGSYRSRGDRNHWDPEGHCPIGTHCPPRRDHLFLRRYS